MATKLAPSMVVLPGEPLAVNCPDVATVSVFPPARENALLTVSDPRVTVRFCWLRKLSTASAVEVLCVTVMAPETLSTASSAAVGVWLAIVAASSQWLASLQSPAPPIQLTVAGASRSSNPSNRGRERMGLRIGAGERRVTQFARLRSNTAQKSGRPLASQ
jgi:hypothetical protein